MTDLPKADCLRAAANAIERYPPELSSDEIRRFVADYLGARERYLKLICRHGSPLYVIDVQALCERAEQLVSTLDGAMPVRTHVYYAVKSNNHPLVANTFLECGLGLDVSSGRELELAIRLGAEKILFSGPGKTEAELDLAVRHSDRVTVLMDSFAELEKLASCAHRSGREIRAGIRLTSDPTGSWRKFGVGLERLEEFLAAAGRHPPVRVEGVQFHTSWNLNPDKQVGFIRLLGRSLGELPADRRDQMRFIDIGGGYWPERGEWLQSAGTSAGMLRNALVPNSAPRDRRFCLPSVSIQRLAEELGRAIRAHLLPCCSFEVYVEPGRWLCSDGMHLLMTVVDRKTNDLVITDAGTNAVGWERFETDFFPVINLTRPSLEENTCEIQGCLCTPRDLWGYSYWGRDIQPGDTLLIPAQGAYTYSLRQDFIKPVPKIAML